MAGRPRPPFSPHEDSPSSVSETEVRDTRADAVDRAERALEQQREQLRWYDQMATSTLQFVLTLAGIVFAVAGIGSGLGGVSKILSVQTTDLPPTAKIATVISGVSLLGTAYVAAGSYVVAGYSGSISSSAAELVSESRFSTSSYYRLLLRAYSDAVDSNSTHISRNGSYFGATLCLLLLSITELFTAVVVAVLAPLDRAQGAVLAISIVGYLLFTFWVVTGRN